MIRAASPAAAYRFLRLSQGWRPGYSSVWDEAPMHRDQPPRGTSFAAESIRAIAMVVHCSLTTDLCHTWTHGKQGQRQERNQESSEAQAETGTRAQTRSVYASPAEIIRKKPLAAL